MSKHADKGLRHSRLEPESDRFKADSRLRGHDKAIRHFLISFLPILLVVAGYPSESVSEQQQRENRYRQPDPQGQRLHGTMAAAPIPQKKEKSGKQANHHANQHENDDESEHERLS